MDDDAEDEEDDPSSSNLIAIGSSDVTTLKENFGEISAEQKEEKVDQNNDRLLRYSKQALETDDILYFIYSWLFPKELMKCMTINKKWNETSKDNFLWKSHCFQCFERVSSKTFANKYDSLYLNYYLKHSKIRFDGCYVLKVLYFVESEASLASMDASYNQISPYTTIEYYRYLRFFNAQYTHESSNKNTKKHAIYALSKKHPSKFELFNCFKSNHRCHKDAVSLSIKSNGLVAKYEGNREGITMKEKVYRAQYSIAKKKYVSFECNTDYGLKLKMDLSYGLNDRLLMKKFNGVSLDQSGNEIEYTSRDYEIRHEPFIFISDNQLKYVNQYFQ